MVDNITKKMIRAYEEYAPPQRFFSGMFQSPPENFHNAAKVTIDIQRNDEDVAIVVDDLSTDGRMNTDELYTNKEFVPPLFKEKFVVSAGEQLNRQFGSNPFDDPDFQAQANVSFFRKMRKVEDKIRRAEELQAAQVLTTGKVDLKDASGVTKYAIDYKPKSTHFPTVSNTWGGAGATPLADINSIAGTIRDDGLLDPNLVIMNGFTWNIFIQDSNVIAQMNTIRIDQWSLTARLLSNSGGQFRGTIQVGTYAYEIWTYDGKYTDPQTGSKTKYLPDHRVIVRSMDGRLDACFGGIPIFQAQRILPAIPARLSRPGGGMDMTTNSWMSPDGEHLFGWVGSRPIYIPTAIDTFGCIKTTT